MKIPRIIVPLCGFILVLSAGCASPPKGISPAPEPGRVEPPSVSDSASAIVQTARSYLGTPYGYGGKDRQGMDCSGLVLRTFLDHGIRLPRSSRDQFSIGQKIAWRELYLGDLIFFSDDEGAIDHVGIYSGKGKFIHASTSRRKVVEDPVDTGYFREHFVGARRIVN